MSQTTPFLEYNDYSNLINYEDREGSPLRAGYELPEISLAKQKAAELEKARIEKEAAILEQQKRVKALDKDAWASTDEINNSAWGVAKNYAAERSGS